MDNNVSEETIDRKADELMRNMEFPVDHQSHIWWALKLGITAGVGLGVDKAREIFNRAAARAQ